MQEVTAKWGFGLERLGLFSVRFPVPVFLSVMATLCAIIFSLPALQFDGDVTRLLRSQRVAYKNYQVFLSEFPEFGSTLSFHLTSRKGPLISSAGLEKLKAFQLELALEDGVASVLSPFTLQQFDPALKRLVPLLPAKLENIEIATHLGKAVEKSPAFRSLISLEADAVLLMTSLEEDVGRSNDKLIALIEDIKRLASANGLTLLITGTAAIQAELIGALIKDQILVMALSVLFGIIIALIIFREWRSVLLCTLTTIVATSWTIGMMILLGQPLDAMTTILPILASVLAFADAVHLLMHWRKSVGDGVSVHDALTGAIKTVGPATALTSVTTMVAFASLAMGGAPLYNLAFFGVLTAIGAFLSVILVLPAAAVLLVRVSGFVAKDDVIVGRWIAPLMLTTAIRRPWSVVVIAVMAVMGLFVIHLTFPPSFKTDENLHDDALVRTALIAIDRDFGGTDRLAVLLPLAPGESLGDAALRTRVIAADEAIAKRLGQGQVASVATIWREIGVEKEPSKELLAQLLQAPGIVGREKKHILISANIPGSLPAKDLRALHRELSAIPELVGTTITGFAMMAAFEATSVVKNLKLGLLIAVLATAALIAIKIGSLRVFVAVALANLLVVLLVEAIIWALGQPARLTLYIALTIALGIGVDDGVHVLNLWLREDPKIPVAEAVSRAVYRAAPALAAATFVLSANVLVTIASGSPAISFIGTIVSGTLVIALLSNVIVLPAVLVAGK